MCGGSGFAADSIYGLLSGEASEEEIKLGWAHGALLTTFPGDTTTQPWPRWTTCGHLPDVDQQASSGSMQGHSCRARRNSRIAKTTLIFGSAGRVDLVCNLATDTLHPTSTSCFAAA